MADTKVELCTLYVFYNDDKRLLYVREEAEFPARFNQDDWRKIAWGVEPPPSGEMSLKRFAYFPTRLPKKNLH